MTKLEQSKLIEVLYAKSAHGNSKLRKIRFQLPEITGVVYGINFEKEETEIGMTTIKKLPFSFVQFNIMGEK